MDDDARPELPPGRYDRQAGPLRRRLLWVLAAVGAVLALAIGGWYAWGVFHDPVQWQDVGFHVDDDRSIQVTFDVIKAPGSTVTCRVHALSHSFGEVGVTDVEVGPASTRTQRVTVAVATSELAVTGTVDRCSAAP